MLVKGFTSLETKDGVEVDRNSKHIVVVGGGYVGLYTALRLQQKLRKELREGSVRITVVTPESHMTYQPFLPEAAAGNLSPRHVVVPLRRVLSKARSSTARSTKVDHARQARHLRAQRRHAARDHLRHRGHGRRLDLPHAPHPRPGRRRDRLQDRRGGHRAAQPRPRAPRPRRERRRRDPAQAGPDLRRRRRRLRGRRGARRAGGHGGRRHPLLPEHLPRGHALDPRRGHRPHPPRGRPGDGQVDRRAAARARHRGQD